MLDLDPTLREKRTACSSPNAPSPPTWKMTGTFQSCEWEKLGDRLAGDSGTRSGPAVWIFSHREGVAASHQGPHITSAEDPLLTKCTAINNMTKPDRMSRKCLTPCIRNRLALNICPFIKRRIFCAVCFMGVFVCYILKERNFLVFFFTHVNHYINIQWYVTL